MNALADINDNLFKLQSRLLRIAVKSKRYRMKKKLLLNVFSVLKIKPENVPNRCEFI